jgi:amino acid transporter
MKQNMGTLDRLIRFILAVIIGILYFTGQISGTAAIVLGVIAIAFILTSAVGHCPAYTPLKISTKKANKE